MNKLCSSLDDYLLGDLSPADEATFAEHLHSCSECQEAIDQQQWINDLVHASSQIATEVPPSHIADDLRAVVARRESFRKRAVRIALATAATLLVAITSLLNHPTGTSPERVAISKELPTAPKPPHAKFVAGRGTIAVPIESRHPDVTIVRVYSTFQPADNSKMAALEPESNNLNDLTDFSNGG
jgi:anti-sigma factor RsiW